MMQVNAPFTPEQVNSFNEYQVAGKFHPFTCGFRWSPQHDIYSWGTMDRGQLVATVDALICPACEYRQSWMWSWMADGSWR